MAKYNVRFIGEVIVEANDEYEAMEEALYEIRRYPDRHMVAKETDEEEN